MIPFELSRIQSDMQDKAGNRNITLKPRQIGSTTWHILCRLFMKAILEPGTSGLLISQTKAYGAQHFRILQRALKNFGRTPSWMGNQNSQNAILSNQVADEMAAHLLHTHFSARHEILFDFLDSKVLVESSENKDAGTGLTVNHLVATEVAYWQGDPESLLAQAKETVPADGTVDIESTPNGMGGYFFEEWQRAQEEKAEFRSHFYPWWWQEEYQLEPPVKEDSLSDYESKMAKEFAWTLKQVAWRRGKVLSLRGKFEEKYPENPVSCFLTSGDTFFDKDILRGIKTAVQNKKPLDSYHSGQLQIYKRRIRGRRYIIGADPCEGTLVSTENPDFNAAIVLDVDSGEMVADYKSRVPQEQFAEDLVALGEQYNLATVAVERNIGQTTILTMQRQFLYGNLYYHLDWWKEGKAKSAVKVPGWPMNVRFRPLALNKLKELIHEAPEFVYSERWVNEAFNFVWTASKKNTLGGGRKPAAQLGAHDDLVMASSIAAIVRLILLGSFDPLSAPSEKYGDTGEPEEEGS